MKSYYWILGISVLFPFVYSPISLASGLNLEYSTYLGGSSYEGHAYAAMGGIAVDSEGCAYVSGITGSDNFPTKGAYQSGHILETDVFISKFSSSGSSLVFSTYLGGHNDDYSFGIAIDLDKCAYLTGGTASTDFPTVNPYQSSYAGSGDAIVVKLTSSGSDLLYSTYIGGAGQEIGYDIALGSDTSAHITGDVHSVDFPTYNPYQAHYGGGDIWGGDAFVAGLSTTGSILLYSSYLGGADRDYGNAIAIASDGSICVVGITDSENFPIFNAYQQNIHGIGEAYIMKLSCSGSEVQFSTYMGGSDNDGAWDIVPLNTAIYVTGETFSVDFPTLNAYQSSYSGISYPNLADAFIACIDPGTGKVIFSSYLGGNGTEYGYGIEADSSGNIYVIGRTNSGNFPTINAYQSSIGLDTEDAFASKISSSGSFLIFSTYLGGDGNDGGENLAIDSSGCFYMSGDTESENFPTINSYQASYAGNIDTFVSKFKWEPSPTPTPIPPSITLDSGDYDGDGRSEIGVFRPSNGLWAIRGLGRIHFGMEGDIPVSGDYDGDGITDVAIFRPGSGLWAIKEVSRLYFGGRSDIPIPRDYDGDGSCDIAVFNAGMWNLRDISRFYHGTAGDIPVPEDYDGDGVVDAAIFRPFWGLWDIRDLSLVYFGRSGDIPVPSVFRWYGAGEKQGPFRAQIAIFRPASGLWAIMDDTRLYAGSSGDFAVPADYDGNSLDDLAVFRPSSGLWVIRNLTRCWFGSSDDIPVTR